jgi:polyisoprenoid-binding protein YceI
MIRYRAFAAALALASVSLHATPYMLEPNYTQGVFRWNHLGFSNPAAQFGQGEGMLEFDPMHPTAASVTVKIPLSSINTGVPDLDDDFRSSDFFDTARFPIATFKSTKVEKAAMPDHLKVSGDLDLHGVTKPLMLDVAILKVGTNPRTNLATVGFEATTMLKRSDFGIGKFIPQVSDEISIHITSQAVDAKTYSQYLKDQADRDAAKQAADAAKQ